LPDYAKCGNRIPRIGEEILEIVDKFIKTEYETHKQKNKREVYGEFENFCKEEGITAIPSYKFFVAWVNNRPLHEQVEKRAGSKAAYPFEPFYWELLYTLPRHGDYPFQITHLDHTQLDIELIDLRTGKNLGRPWLTLLIDSYSRRILAVYLSFDKPSYRSCMMVLRECVFRHKRFPEMVVVDGGKEFHSDYFDALLARYNCSKATRPKSKSRFGSEMERVFGTTNEEFIHNLEGNTQATKNVRQLTPAVDPKRHAVWTLGELYARLQEWAYERFDTNEHGGIGQTPAEAFNQGIHLWGRRGGDLIPFNDDFVYYTLPTTPKGTAKLDPILGVKIKNIYYRAKHNIFRKNRKLHKKQIPVRYDPFDVGHAYTYVNGEWVECLSEHHVQLRGRTEREIQVASEELRARHRRHGQQFNITAAKLAAFITSVEGQEALLTQRRKDIELRGVLTLMGKSTLELHGLSIVTSESFTVANGEVSPATAPTIDLIETPDTSDDDQDIYEVVLGA
jgi:putative transposase